MMKIIKENLCLVLLLIVVNMLAVFSVNYMIANELSSKPFGLEKNAIKLVKTGDAQSDVDLSVLTDNKDIILIGLTQDSSVIGLYDPTMKYYVKSSKFVDTKSYRYFSQEDYISKKKVAIAGTYIERDLNNPFKFIDKKTLEKTYDTKIINIFDENSLIFYESGLFSKSGTPIVKNLFSLNLEQINAIYIDAEDIHKIEETKNIINNFGFSEEKDKSSIISLWRSFNETRKYVKFVVISFMVAYLVMLYAFYITIPAYKLGFLEKKKNHSSKIAIYLLKIFSYLIITSGIASVLSMSYLKIINKNFLNFSSLLVINLCLIVGLLIVFIAKVINLIYFKKTEEI